MSSYSSLPCARDSLRVAMRIPSDATDGRALRASREDWLSRQEGITYYIRYAHPTIFRLAFRIDLVASEKRGVVQGMPTMMLNIICGMIISGTVVPSANSVCFGSISLMFAPAFSMSSRVTTMFSAGSFLVLTHSALAHGQVSVSCVKSLERNQVSP